MNSLRTMFPTESVATLCALFGKTRQAFYKWCPPDFSEGTMEEIIIKEVKRLRETAPEMGATTLYPLMLRIFGKENMIGRDRFYTLLKARGLQLKHHRAYRKWKNLIKGLVVTAPNQLWISDITYIRLTTGIVYLHLITDAYSRMILGWKVADSLEARHSLDAFNTAVKGACNSNVDFSKLIHHSNQGVQYHCNLYVNRLLSLDIQISMAEGYKSTDNAKAEHINSIIKQLFIDGQNFVEISEVYYTLSQGIVFYNDVRPHGSFGHEPPSRVHAGLVNNV